MEKREQPKEFKIRASACGKIMGSRGLGKGGETYCRNWLKGQLLNRQAEIKSKYLDKGNIMEDESLDAIAKHLGLGMLIKNEKQFENDYFTGMPDALPKPYVVDAKNSWSWETFPYVDVEVPDKDYYWQGQCYMALTKKKQFKLVYTLLDTPQHLIEREARYYCLNNGWGELDQDILEQFIKKMTYSDIPEEKRIKVFDIARNDADISAIETRVLECRDYIKTLSQ